MLTGFILFAGDVARFVDLGFSTDGKTYLFGEYGKTDKKFLPYAEIFVVDVKKNVFVWTAKTEGKQQAQSGSSVFDELRAQSTYIAQFNSTPVPTRQILYLREDDEKPAESVLEFQDFERTTGEGGLHYIVTLVPHVQGTGKNVQSSFYINVERRTPEGSLVDRTVVGSPDFKRSGVLGYRIEKIFTDASGSKLVFVIEKTLVDEQSVSIRYMVETVALR
jgi:predicted secreted protein